MNTEEIKLSTTSYIDKDFASLYPDLISLAGELTNEWDPAQSNESDPGVVLIKEAAFVADHTNYNIDKNVLENFLPSATQERSVRNIVEMNGYTPQYYISANGNVNFTYTIPEGSTLTDDFTIEKFTLVISNDDNSVSYTQSEDLKITLGKGSCKFIEGTLQHLTVNDSNIITVSNLDDNNRIYLPESMIAQNGIYVKNTNKSDYNDYWENDNYLLTRPVGSHIYKLDYDSYKSLPYIEFPSDIANLIGDGLTISYISTTGSNGNVSANTLVNIMSPDTFYDILGNERAAENFSLTNISSISNGKNPETINDMYRSFKKIVGTFDTLVTTKDYSNKIRTITDSLGNNYISNGYASDRRIDYNKAANVISRDYYGEYFDIISLASCALKFIGYFTVDNPPTSPKKGDIWCQEYKDSLSVSFYKLNYFDGAGVKDASTINLNDFAILTAAMTPYDLSLYCLTPYTHEEDNPVKALNNTYTKLDNSTISQVEKIINSTNCVSHNYNEPSNVDLYCFKNKVPLDIIIITYNKVSLEERDEIIKNIKNAIADNFNSSKLDFGEELDYDSVENVIVNSDPRIKRIKMKDFNYETYALSADGNNNELGIDSALPSSSAANKYTIKHDLVAKNVLAGRVCLFNFTTDFDFKYGQKGIDVYRSTVIDSTSIKIPSTKYTTGYTLRENENVQIIYPNYYTDKTFSLYVKYIYTGATIKANTDYTLNAGEQITVYYTVDGAEVSEVIPAGTVVRTSFDLEATEKVKTLSSNQTISTRYLAKTILNTSNIQCYWIVNNEQNALFSGTVQEKVLGDNEYFIYANSSLDEMIILGAGTKLNRSDTSFDWKVSKDISIKTIEKEGAASIIPWKVFDFSTYNFSITEMNVISIGEQGMIIINDETHVYTDDIVNEWKCCNSTIKYKTSLTSDEVTLDYSPNFYQIRSRLDLNCSSTSPQKLYANPDQIIYVGVTEKKEIKSTSDTQTYVQPSSQLVCYGGNDLKLEDYSLFHYSTVATPEKTITIEKTDVFSYNFFIEKKATASTTSWVLLPVYILGNEIPVNVNVYDGTTKLQIKEFNSSDAYADSMQLSGNSLHFISFENNFTSNKNLTFKIWWTVPGTGMTSQQTVFIDDFKVANGINNKLGTVDITKVLGRINEIIANSDKPSIKPYYTHDIDSSIAINNPDFDDPNVMWDINNVANFMTIPQIDLVKSKIDIDATMKGY